MPELPPHISQVDGFSIEVELSVKSFFSKPEHRKLYEESYLQVTIMSDGTNVFAPEEGYWEVIILKQKTEDILVPKEYIEEGYISLDPNEDITHISIVEETIGTQSGIWIAIGFEDINGAHLAHTYKLYQYGSA